MTLTLLDLNFDFVFDFDFDFDFDFGALQNTSQTLATMAIVTLPKRRRTPLPLRFIHAATVRKRQGIYSLPVVCILSTCALPSGTFNFVVVPQ